MAKVHEPVHKNWVVLLKLTDCDYFVYGIYIKLNSCRGWSY